MSGKKKDIASLRQKLNFQLQNAEDQARDVLRIVNQLRHGNLDALSGVDGAIERTKLIGKALKGVGAIVDAAA